MTKCVTAPAEADIFAFEVSDDALERSAAVADGLLISVGYCTHWYACNWPLSPPVRPAAAGQKG
jgi:hypothetical protein